MSGLARLLDQIRVGARIVAGAGCYDDYLVHMRDRHPTAVPLTEIEYFRDRQDARFGGGSNSSCC